MATITLTKVKAGDSAVLVRKWTRPGRPSVYECTPATIAKVTKTRIYANGRKFHLDGRPDDGVGSRSATILLVGPPIEIRKRIERRRAAARREYGQIVERQKDWLALRERLAGEVGKRARRDLANRLQNLSPFAFAELTDVFRDDDKNLRYRLAGEMLERAKDDVVRRLCQLSVATFKQLARAFDVITQIE